MGGRAIVILDVGKTNTKVSLWAADGVRLAQRVRANTVVRGDQYMELDVPGITPWLATALSEFSTMADVGYVVPCGHGAAAAIIADGRLHRSPLDYEDAGCGPDDAYDAKRDPFGATGSPALPLGLNLGRQLHRLEALGEGALPGDARIVTWPQYWAWVLSGVAAVEVSSLGCHSDLWRPGEGRYSDLAEQRGWADRMAPLRRAADRLGMISEEWRQRTTLPSDCVVLCGLHDSNAALHGVRGYRALHGSDVTVLSTGTWFVAMRAMAEASSFNISSLNAKRDCLLNVDLEGRPVPSARFMGGREAEMLCENSVEGAPPDERALLALAAELVAGEGMATPPVIMGVGPFPAGLGVWSGNIPEHPFSRRVATGLYLALMTEAMVELLQPRENLVIEGRFARDTIFVRALAALLPGMNIYLSDLEDGVAYGALRLVNPDLPPPSPLVRVEPLPIDLTAYRSVWRRLAGGALR